MDIVVKLPDTNITEDIIRAAKWEDGSLFDMVLRGAMKNAIILPKGHGAIKDVSQIEIPMCEDRTYERWVQVAIDSAPTIIEMDKEQKDDNT